MGLSFRCVTLVLVSVLGLLFVTAAVASNGEGDGRDCPPDRSDFEGPRTGPQTEARQERARNAAVGDRGVIEEHFDQDRINAGQVSFDTLFKGGKELFRARFNKFDGQGRPEMTSGGNIFPGPQGIRPPFKDFFRTGGPDTGTCWSCHNVPRTGGAGDFNSLMFTGLHALNPPEHNTTPNLTNPRQGPSIFGAGALEMLAREMTVDLHAIRDAAKAAAAASGQDQTVSLVTKGVSFGSLTVRGSDGKIDPTNIQGIDWDLIVKPFTHKGTGVSLRGFSVGGSFLHLGMSAVERFGTGDEDKDGVAVEFTLGDVTAMTLWMAGLPTPGRVIPKERARRDAMNRGEQLFSQIQCASCHTPAMVLNVPVFSEPSPYNGQGLLKVTDVPAPFRFDLTEEGPRPRPEKLKGGKALIRAFTDFKRHDLNDPVDPDGPLGPINHFNNEQLPGGSVRGQAPASDFTIAAPNLSTRVFMTEHIWDCGNTMQYGHGGDLSTLSMTVKAHGGEAAASRAAFDALDAQDKACVIEFLRSLQVVPEGPRETFQEEPLN
jgi:hypothetical protein